MTQIHAMQHFPRTLIIVLFMTAAATTVCGQADDPAQLPPESGSTASMSPAAARQQAEVLHEVMHSALRVTHDRYYREDEGMPIPASILKEVFDDVKQKNNITLRWLVVEGQAMNTDHEAQDDFEIAAAKALKAGKKSFEKTIGNMYRRAGPITLSNHCLKCHVPDRRNTRDRTAGLLISIPLNAK